MAKSSWGVLLVLCLPFVSSFSEVNEFRPVIKSVITDNGKPAFHGELKESEQVVQLRPGLAASDDDKEGGARFICEYVISKNKRHPRTSPLPFDIKVTDKLTGAAEIRVKEGHKLSFNDHPYYKFGIYAQDCGAPSKRSRKAYVMIKVLPDEVEDNVQEADKFSPKFDEDSYYATVEEGKMYDSIVKIHASDQDETDAFKTICNYDLMTANAPFEITQDGVVRNTEPLDYSIHRNFILEVIASDCGGRRSDPVFVNLKVAEKCRSGWSGLQDVIKYRAGSGQQRLAEGAELRLCNEDCSPRQVNVKVTLATKHIGKGCDRDTYSVNSQRKLCGASGNSVDLLPTPGSGSWSHNIPTDDGHEMDQVFSFDGVSNALEVPESVFNHMLHEHFTISAWLRHGAPQSSRLSKAPKEHILCMSDGEGMNRHHYGLYIHGDKLVLLLRKEAEDVHSPKDMEVFKPAEFRWRIPHVMDNEWHHYAVSVDKERANNNDGGVSLHIDGKLLATSEDTFEIIDDWPLHKSQKVHSTKLTVGGCWQGADKTFAHYYKGYMAGLFVLKGDTESDRVIKCLNNCKENLDFHAVSDMSTGTSVSFNADLTEFTISSRTVEEVNHLMSQVAYVNARTYPTPGYRTLNIETSLVCDEETVVLPMLERRVLVEEQQEPLFVITGYSNLTRMVYEFEKGLKVFHDIHIYARSQPLDEDEEEDDDDEMDNGTGTKLSEKLTKKLMDPSSKTKDDDDFMIDECHVKADPPLNLFIEHLTLPTHLMEMHGLEWMETNNGVDIKNADTISNYENVIRDIHYYHNKPEDLANRTLTLYCSSQNQRFLSTKFIERLVAVHQAAAAPRAAHIQSDAMKVQASGMETSFSQEANGIANTSNLGMVAIIVVCVGFLLFMIILGVIRIRSAHNRTQVLKVPGQDELEWDDSGLNITINPMEQEMFEYEDGAAPTFPEDSDSEDDETSMQGDYGDSTEDEEPVVRGSTARGTGRQGNELEWDHTSI